MSNATASKLAALRAANTPTPLWVFLYLYSKAEHDCYIEYMAGAKDLYLYLTSGGTIPLDYQEHLYPEIGNRNFVVPSLLSGYASQELGAILTTPPIALSDEGISVWLMDARRADRAIYITMSQKVIPLLY